MALYSPHFELTMDVEYQLMRLDPESPSFESDVVRILGDGRDGPDGEIAAEYYRGASASGSRPTCRRRPGGPSGRLLPREGLAGPGRHRVHDDRTPTPACPVSSDLAEDTFGVTTQLTARDATVVVRFVFRLLESFDEQRLVFSPLLERFIAGEDYRSRPVKVSDSGRIRNELQTLCSQALEYTDESIVVHFDRINDDVILPEDRGVIRSALEWYKENHPVWFSWLELG